MEEDKSGNLGTHEQPGRDHFVSDLQEKLAAFAPEALVIAIEVEVDKEGDHRMN